MLANMFREMGKFPRQSENTFPAASWEYCGLDWLLSFQTCGATSGTSVERT